MMKRSTALVLVLCMLVSLCVTALAAQEQPNSSFASNYFISYGCTLGDIGGQVLYIIFSTVGMGLCDELGVATYSVDKLVTLDDGSQGWMIVAADLPGQTGQNVPSYTYAINFQGVAGETYRVRVTFVCQKTFGDGTTGMEHKSFTSSRVTIN